MMDELSLAVTLVETGQYEEGLRKIKEILNNADDDTAFQIANLYEQWGMADEAYNILKRLHRVHPGHSDILLALGEAALDLGKEDEALEWLSSIHPLDENYLSAELLLADIYQAQGLEEVAENHLLKAHRAAPEEPVILFALAEFYMSTGQPGKAEKYYKEVLHAERLAHENVALKLAEALSLNGKFEEALLYYRKGLEKEKTLDGLFGYGVTALRVGKNQTAIRALEELKELDPNYSTLYPVLAEAYRNEGAMKEAMATLEEGMKVDEHNERLFLEAADLAVKNGELDRAESYLQRLLEWEPEHLEALRKLAALKKEKGQNDEVIRLVTEQEEEDPDLLWFLAEAYMEEDRVDDALEVYGKIADYFADDPQFLAGYGEAAWQSGDREKALGLFRAALKIDPTNEELRGFVERLEEDF